MKRVKKIIAFCLALAICLPMVQMKSQAAGASYSHGWCFENSTKKEPEGAKVNGEDSFSYEYGVNGKFSPMTKFNADWNSWTLNGQAPAIGQWYASGSEAGDGTIAWTAPRNMNVSLSSEVKIVLDATNAKLCDGVGLMVVQQNDYGFAPLWPKKGVFKWHDVKNDGETNLNDIKTKVRKGDRILFVVHTLGKDSVGDTIEVAPKVEETTSNPKYPVGFYDWVSDGKVQESTGSNVVAITTYNNGWAFTESDKKQPEGAKFEDGSVFRYKYGINGVFSPLTKYNSEWGAWTLNGQAPAASSWYVSATTGIDGAMEFTAGKDMHVDVSSEIKVVVDSYLKDKCDGAGLMILQQTDKGFAPLWPSKGNFKWYDVKKQGDVILSGIQTYMKKGEKILIVAHSIGTSEGDNVNIAPKICEIEGGTSYPTKFVAWEKDPNAPVDIMEEEFISSWYIGEGNVTTNTDNDSNPFSYVYGDDGKFDKFLTKREKFDWGYVWRLPDLWAPWVAPYFISTAKDADGVVTFTAPRDGNYKLSNNLGNVLKLDTSGGNESDGVQFAVVAQNAAGKYAPLYPARDSWEWQKVEKDKEYKFEPIEVSLKKGEKIFFIVHNSGNEVNDTLAFDAKVGLKKTGDMSKYPKSFVAWPEGFSDPDEWANPASLADLFSKEKATVGPLSLKWGYDGDYDLLTLYREDWNAWTKGGSSPAIGVSFMGSFAKNDAVLVYTAPETGKVNVYSTSEIALDWPDESDGTSIIVVVKNETGERPIWPVDGKWEYKKITQQETATMKDISAFVQKGDEVHIILRSTGNDDYDSVTISPVFDLDTSVTTGMIPVGVERVYPTEDDFVANLLDIDGKLDGIVGGDEFPIVPVIIGGVCAIALTGIIVFVIVLVRKNKKKGAQTV